MMQHALQNFPWPWLSAGALLIFFSFFAGLLIHLARRSQQPALLKGSLLPLEEGERYE